MIKYSRVRKIHFVGIGGSGMSGIAEVLHNMGFIISGSDIAENESINRLRSMGIKIYLGHSRDNVKDIETLVFSSAIKKENLEILEALRRKIPVISRAEMLSELMRLKFSIAVAGTHGKTTTTSMIAAILRTAKKDPTYVVGGRLKIDESGAKLGKSDYLVAEADESDGSFLKLFPTIAVITNIENDHLDYYQGVEVLKVSFEKFCNKVPFYGSVILNLDCENSRSIIPHLNKRVITYGLNSGSLVKAEKIRNSIFGIRFNLIYDRKNHGTMTLNVGGIHNVSNALAAITTAMEIGLDLSLIREGLNRFYLPERRFQVLFTDEDNLVIDDYAHHPTEIKATVNTLRTGDFKRIIVVFQPHRFTRLKILMDDFVTAFNGVDLLVIGKLYTAGQKEIANVNSGLLAKKIKESGFKEVQYFNEFDEIIRFLEQEVKENDAIAFLSAGDLTVAAHQFARILKSKKAKERGREE